MNAWLFIVLIFAGLILFLIFIVWLDWLYKCRKSAKNHSLKSYLPGYYIFRHNENKNMLIILDGILGINSAQMVFANRFKNDAFYMRKDISRVCAFQFADYDENEFLEYANKFLTDSGEKVVYYKRTMAGVSISRRLPKGLKTRIVCKINFYYEEDKNEIEADGYFFTKSTAKNIEKIEEIQKYIRT